jgi:hypothetical protein
MKEIYTQHSINEFFEEFKNLPNSYKIEQVHQLLNNPNAKATQKVNFHFKHLKLIIMTSAFLIGITTTFLWFSPKNTNIDITSEKLLENQNKIIRKDIGQNPDTKNEQNFIVSENLVSNKVTNGDFKSSELVLASNNQHFEKDNVNPVKPQKSNKRKSKSCIWPTDTIIDKDLLLVTLTDEELKQIGIARKGNAIFYHNICPNGDCDWQLSCQTKLIPKNERITTHNDFYVRFVTNSNFEPDGGLDFYSSMDIYVPIVTKNKAEQIFWFTPHDSLFARLPHRYSYLKNTYDNLICLKEKYPNKTFTNFLSTGGESILEAINFLKPTKQELNNIGIKFSEGNIIFQSKNTKYSLKISSKGSTYSTGSDEDFKNFPPNPYPVVMTDTLGRRIFVQKTIIDKDSLSQIMNILVPIRINLNEVIPPNKDVMICWYYPTEDFLNSFPDKIGEDLKSEVETITETNQSSTKSCTYFEVCKSTLQLDNFKLYPNPAKYSATIEFDISEEAKGSISIVNIAGARLKTLVSNSTFLSGRNTYQMDLSGITPGIYLISINTDKGFKTQRLIISQ